MTFFVFKSKPSKEQSYKVMVIPKLAIEKANWKSITYDGQHISVNDAWSLGRFFFKFKKFCIDGHDIIDIAWLGSSGFNISILKWPFLNINQTPTKHVQNPKTIITITLA